MIYGLVFCGALVGLGAHELGHYIAARVLNVPVLSVIIGCGPELIRLRARNNTSWSLRLLPIIASIAYVETAVRSRFHHALVLVSGPIANFLLGLIGLGGAAAVWHHIIPTSNELFASAITTQMWFIGGLSLAIGLFNLLPLPPLDGGALVLLALRQHPDWPEPKSFQRAQRAGVLVLSMSTMIALAWLLGSLCGTLR